jgi:hypothetical protein
MARWTGCLGSRRRDHGERLRFNATGGDPGLGGPPAAPASVTSERQASGFPPDARPAGAPQATVLVIRARRAGDVSPMSQPDSAA